MRCAKVGWIMGLGGLVWLAGCGAAPGENKRSDWVERDAGSWRLSDRAGLDGTASLATTLPVDSEVGVPAGAGAEDYVRLALERNPSIHAARAKVRRMGERIPQVTSLDDPMLNVTPIGQMAETAAGQVGLMTGISQKLPFPGKLDARGGIAAADVEMAKSDLERIRLAVIADTRQAYWGYYFSTRAIEVTQQSRDLLAQLQQSAESRYKANLATQQDVLRANVELSNLDNELLTLAQQRTTAAAMLNSLLDRSVTASLPSPEPVELEKIAVNLDDLLQLAAAANPDLSKINARIEGERQRLRLAKLQRWPDLTVGLTYNFVDEDGLAVMANGRDQWWVSFVINLPIWGGKLRAGEREAMWGMREGIADLLSAKNRVAFQVQDAAVKAQTQQRLVILFRDVILPQARQTVDASASGYQAGKVDFLTMVDNWRNLLNYQLMYHQSLAELEKDYARLQEAVGRELPRGEGEDDKDK